MSYILDALKKAEQERGLAKVPTLTTVHAARVWVLGRSHGWLIAGAVLVCAIGAALWVLIPGLTGMVRPSAPRERPAASRTESQPASAPAAPSVPQPTMSAPPVLSAPPATKPRQPAPAAPDAAPQPRALLPPFARMPRQPDAQSRADGGSAVPSPMIERTPRSLPVESLRPNVAPPPTPSPAQPAPSAEPAPSPVSRPIVVPAPPTPAAPGVPASPAPGAPVVTPPASLPPAQPAQPSLQQALAKLTLDMLVYTEAESTRMVTINGRKYVKGDAVEGRYIVEEITREGVTLSYGGETAILRP